METEFKEYLKRREEDLLKFHPQFFFTNEEVKASKNLLKPDYSPICIPPSWDLVQKYAGALDENADGFDKELYEKGRRNYVGDQGEAKFLDLMRNLEIGGILIGDVNSQHLFYGQELTNSQKEYYMLPNEIVRPLKKAKGFQFDFLHFNSQVGLLHIEVKRDQKPTMEKFFGYSAQIRDQRRKLQEVFKIFCENIGEQNTQALWFEFFNAPSILMQLTDSKVAKITIKSEHCRSLNDIAAFAQFLNKLCADRNRKKITTNFFEKKVFRQFIIFLSGYRPNFFISPVQCALTVYKNIFTHRINTVNFYSKKKNEPIVQNLSLTVKDFLQNLKFVQNTDINFGEYSKIYLTTEQMEAIGKFDGEGNFSPRLQLIHGPPGSGKSLIMMIKMFICGQMEQRKDRPIIYSTVAGGVRGPGHQQKLAAFIENNRRAFCREFSFKRTTSNSIDINELNGDFFVDEEFQYLRQKRRGSLKDSGKIITAIFTGLLGDTANPKDYYLTKHWRFTDLGFDCVTQLRTVFRSSRQIQRYFFEHSKYLKASISLDSLSGHNYDGVKVETHDFPNYESGLRFVEERLIKLVDIEGCRETDIGLAYNYPLFGDKLKEGEQIKQIRQRICQRFKNISVYDFHYDVPSLEFPVMLIVDEPSDSIRRFLLASRAICHLIVCNVIYAHVKRSGKLML